MNTLRIVSLGVAIMAGVLLVSGSFGFTSTTANRGVSVGVADDEEAFVGYDSKNRAGIKTGETVTLVDVTNRFDQGVNVSGIELDSGDSVEFGTVDTPETIPPGQSKPVTAEVAQCTSDTEVTATVTVEGDSVKATLFGDSDSETVERSFTIRCTSPESQAAVSYTTGEKNSNGDGPARIIGVETGTAVEATVLYENKTGHVLRAHGEFVAGKPLKTQLGGTAKGRNTIRCVEIGTSTYEHPDRPGACEML